MPFELSDINARISRDARGFAEECEAQYADKVARAVGKIARNMV
jgi:hypothetical protein